jgi:hypothetical protein
MSRRWQSVGWAVAVAALGVILTGLLLAFLLFGWGAAIIATIPFSVPFFFWTRWRDRQPRLNKHLSPEDAADTRRVSCPHCNALAGQHCRDRKGRPVEGTHSERGTRRWHNWPQENPFLQEVEN